MVRDLEDTLAPVFERRPRDEEGAAGGGGRGSIGDTPPAVRPRGAEQRSSSPGDEMDVDDIPF